MKRLAAAGLLVFACAPTIESPAPAPPRGPVNLALPAAPGSLAPFLHVGPEGLLRAAWLDPLDAGGHALRVATRAEGSWSTPVTVASGPSLLANWADTPTLRDLGRGRLAVSWPVQRSGGHAYELAVAFSQDDGSSWGAPIRPHSDDTDTEHGFPVFGPASGSGVELAWLDGRDHAGKEPGTGAMSLRLARVSADGEIAEERVLDPRTCDCCPVAGAVTDEGFALAYRDRSDGGELRDIALLRRVPSGWTEPSLVRADGWEIAGCPVNGPAIDARGEQLAVAWFTAAGGEPAAWVAFSSDRGRNFSEARRFDLGEPVGRVALVLLEDGGGAVAWIEGEVLRLRHLARSGEQGPVVNLGGLPAGRTAGMPRLVRWGQGLAAAWTAPGEPGRVTVVSIDLPPT